MSSAYNIEIAPPSGTITPAQDNQSSPKPFSDDSVSGAANVQESQPDNNDPVPTLDQHRLDQSMQASSVDQHRPIDTSATVFDSTVVTKPNARGVQTLIGDDGKTYYLPLKVNLNQSRSRDMDGVVVNLKTSVRHHTNSHVVFGNSHNSIMKSVPEVIFHASVSGVDSILTEGDLTSFLTRKHILFSEVKCYSIERSLSKTFKVSLAPTQNRRIQNPHVWELGITVKRLFERNSK